MPKRAKHKCSGCNKHYSKGDFKLGENLTWYGDLVTNKELKYQGSTNLHGTIHAKSLDLQGNAKLHLTPSEYWYQEIELQNSGEIMLTGSQLTRFHIKDELELEGNSKINAAGNPLLIFVYGDKKDDEGDVDLEGSAEIHGHLYAQGEVEMQGNTRIYGAVNTFDLEIEGSSAIIYREFLGGDSLLDHYQLHFNTNNDNVTAYACGDNTCNLSNLYAGEVKKLHIHANKSNFHNFDKFYGSSSITKKWNTSQCTIFTIQNADNNKNGANPWPASTPALQCFLDGTRVANCEVCPKPESVNSYGYVYGSATIPSIPSSRTNEFTVKQGGGNGLATAEDNPIAINNGSKLTLPLDVTFNKAEKVDLVLADADEREYPVSVTFVPKQLAWDNSSTECVGENGEFNYKSHHKSCAVLGKAGENTTLAISAYGEGGELIKNYQAEAGNLITINELNAQQKQPEESESKTFDGIKLENGKEEITYSISQVALIQAVIKEHCAPYAIDSQGKCGLPTKGDSQILGRTVPAYLQVTGIAGKITGGVAFRAKPVEFRLPPLFEVVACAANSNPDTCNELPSYTGEFAKGLGLENSLTFSVDNDPDNQLEISDASGEVIFDKNSDDEAITGTHTIQLADSYKFVFEKEAPKKAELISQKLKLSINIENDAVLAGEGTAGLAEDAKLRFGYLTVDNTELAVGTNGKMQTRLNYLDEEGKDKEDKNHPYSIAGNNIKSESISDKSTLPNGSTIKAITKEIEVSAPTVWRGKISIEDAPDWLKPYDEVEKGLVAPSGQLTITDRKRGHDRVFNRREAVQ